MILTERKHNDSPQFPQTRFPQRAYSATLMRKSVRGPAPLQPSREMHGIVSRFYRTVQKAVTKVGYGLFMPYSLGR